MRDDRVHIASLLEQVFCDVEGKRLATRTAFRLAEEILADGYRRHSTIREGSNQNGTDYLERTGRYWSRGGSLGLHTSDGRLTAGEGSNQNAAEMSYHSDPEINAEVAAQALEAEAIDLSMGYPPRRWVCECGAGHSRGHFQVIGVHRCLACGYVGTDGVMELPDGPP